MKSRRAFLMEPGRFEIKEVDIYPSKEQILVKVAACGLCNWELNHWKGQLGEYPQTLGHEVSGYVVEVGEGVTGLNTGDIVTGLLDQLVGFSDYVVMDKDKCLKLKDGFNPHYGTVEPVKCIITVLRGAIPEAGDYGVIQGCGPMGLWCIQALSGNMLSGIIAIDVDENRLALAKKYGATYVINPKKENVEKVISEITGGHMADFVIEGTGIPKLLNDAMNYLRRGRGKLILMSSHESASTGFDFRPAIAKSIELKVTHPAYSLSESDDLRRAVSLLNKGTFNLEETITHVFKLDDINNAFRTLESKPSGYMKGIVIP
ncbi:MAG TPA: zinc-binding dehydrogenase [Ruminiclostridium sp.]